MNRKQLQEQIRLRLGGTATQMAAELALNAVLQALRDGLREEGEVKLARFGTFRITQRRPRRLLLPHSGQELILPARKTVTFHQCPTLWDSPEN